MLKNQSLALTSKPLITTFPNVASTWWYPITTLSHGHHVVISYHNFSTRSQHDNITSPLLHEAKMWWDHITTFPHGQHMLISGCGYWVEVAWVHLFITSWHIRKETKINSPGQVIQPKQNTWTYLYSGHSLHRIETPVWAICDQKLMHGL